MNSFTMKPLLALSLFVTLALPVAAFAKGDAAKGHEKAKQVCGACHGENGDKPLQPEYPMLAGQHQDYLMKALKDYKSGARKNAIMGGQAAPLSEKDIEDVTKWFSEQKTSLHVIEK